MNENPSETANPKRLHAQTTHSSILHPIRRLLECVRLGSMESGAPSVAFLRDVDTGKQFELHRSTNRMTFCSPYHDPDRVAIMIGEPADGPSVKVFDITGEQPVERLSVQLPRRARLEMNYWDSQHRFLFLTSSKGDEPLTELWTLSADTGEMKKMDFTQPSWISRVTRHPDGKQILFQKNLKPLSEIWVMENFLPQTAQTKGN